MSDEISRVRPAAEEREGTESDELHSRGGESEPTADGVPASEVEDPGMMVVDRGPEADPSTDPSESSETHEDRGPEVPAFPDDPAPEDLTRLTNILLSVLFASEEPLQLARLAHAAGASPATARRGLDALLERIRQQGLPFELLENGGAFRIVTHPEYHAHILRLRAVKKNERLSPAALETLAIVAYRQPIIRAEIEAIRGVKAAPLLRTLMDKRLVRVVGRSEVPGRPILYGTTREFLDRFGIASPKDLPSLGELKLGQV